MNMMAWPPKRAWHAGPAGERGGGGLRRKFARAWLMGWACVHYHFKVCISKKFIKQITLLIPPS
jgi:hypothetical protein